MTTVREIRALSLRVLFLASFILLLFVGIIGRYFHLMVMRHDEFLALATCQLNSTREVKGVRGSILDRRGRALAMTRELPSVAVDPGMVATEDRVRAAAEVAAVLGVDPAHVATQLSKNCRFRWIKRHIRDPEVVSRLGELDRRFVIIEREMGRCYPAREVGAHLIGFSGIDGGGLDGAEFAFDAPLSEQSGRKVVLRDGKDGAVSLPHQELRGGSLSEDGQDVQLAMDLTIQTFVEEALEETCAEWTPESAVAVVLDPRNGDVLALSSRPNFDPVEFSRATLDERRNRVVADFFEPGSTMKPLIAAAALENGAVAYDQVFDCTETASWRLDRRVIHDHDPLGILDFPGVVIQSSNIGMAQVGVALGVDRTYRHVRALGFGRKTGCGLPGEAAGMVTAREDWTSTYTVASVSMGHEIGVTPLQFAAAFATLANGGILYRPRLALRIGDREIPPEPLREAFDPDRNVVRRFMVPILTRVVSEGTGKRARIPGYRVAGKTGTAEVKVKGVKVGYVSSFVAFAPAEDPRFLVLVLLNRPARKVGTPYGGTCAAPAVKRILERCLGYAEIPPRDEMEGNGAMESPSR